VGSPTGGPRGSANPDRGGNPLRQWWTLWIERWDRPLQVPHMRQGNQTSRPHAQPCAVSPGSKTLGLRLRLDGQAMVRLFYNLFTLSPLTRLLLSGTRFLRVDDLKRHLRHIHKHDMDENGCATSSLSLSLLLTYHSVLGPISPSPTASRQFAVRENPVGQNPTPPMTGPTTSTSL